MIPEVLYMHSRKYFSLKGEIFQLFSLKKYWLTNLLETQRMIRPYISHVSYTTCPDEPRYFHTFPAQFIIYRIFCNNSQICSRFNWTLLKSLLTLLIHLFIFRSPMKFLSFYQHIETCTTYCCRTIQVCFTQGASVNPIHHTWESQLLKVPWVHQIRIHRRKFPRKRTKPTLISSRMNRLSFRGLGKTKITITTIEM